MLIVHVTADVGEELEETIQKTWPDNIVKLVRSTERLGLIRARLAGADAASGDILVFLDAHCETNIVWYSVLKVVIFMLATSIVKCKATVWPVYPPVCLPVPSFW